MRNYDDFDEDIEGQEDSRYNEDYEDEDDGFDVNYDNFHRIMLQYKPFTQRSVWSM